MTSLRAALGLRTCLRTLTAAAAEPWSARTASLSPLADCTPSTSYAGPECTSGWQRWWRRGSGGSSGGHALSSSSAARWQHSDAARAASAPHQVMYQVVVVTGDVRGAGSPAPAVVTLVGSGECCPLCRAASAALEFLSCAKQQRRHMCGMRWPHIRRLTRASLQLQKVFGAHAWPAEAARPCQASRPL